MIRTFEKVQTKEGKTKKFVQANIERSKNGRGHSQKTKREHVLVHHATRGVRHVLIAL